MIKIGAVNIDTSHPLAFSEYLADGNRARYTAVFNDSFREDDEVEGFIRNHKLEKRCKSLDELAECVDIGFIHSCNWNRHLKYAMPFINRGKPVFIDKPIVGNPADCKALEELAAKGAVILGGSAVRYAKEIVDFTNKPQEEIGKILNIFGTAGEDEFNYAVHIVEAIGGIAGTGAISTRFVGRSEADGKKCETFFVRYNSGITAVYNTVQGSSQAFELVILTTKATFDFRIDTGNIYSGLLDRICEYMETEKNTLASVDELTESIKIMLAGRISRENGGMEVELSGIPENDPGYNGGMFELQYAAETTKMYL